MTVRAGQGSADVIRAKVERIYFHLVGSPENGAEA